MNAKQLIDKINAIHRDLLDVKQNQVKQLSIERANIAFLVQVMNYFIYKFDQDMSKEERKQAIYECMSYMNSLDLVTFDIYKESGAMKYSIEVNDKVKKEWESKNQDKIKKDDQKNLNFMISDEDMDKMLEGIDLDL